MNCQCCNATNDTVKEVQILLRRKLAPGRPSTITLCAACISALPFDIGALIEHANTFKDYETDRLTDAMLYDFLVHFIRDVWIEDRVPTHQEICDCLNAIGIRTVQGKTWSYCNLKYKMDQLRVDRQAYILERKQSTYAERMNDLQARASVWLADNPQYKAPPALKPPDITRLPADMPGQPALESEENLDSD